MLEFLKSKKFLTHLVLAFGVVVILLWSAFSWINGYTLHGETVIVPNLEGKTIDEVEQIIEANKLRFVIVDSVFNAKKKKGSVIDQNPAANMQVKENRTVYLTLNATSAPKVKMPNLIDVSLRQATAMLETYGLSVGKLQYQPDFAKNAVLKQLYNGEVIQPGESIRRGSKIDLVLGDGLSDEKVAIPSVIGLSRSEAVSALLNSSLNIGSEVSDESVEDTAAAIVYRQSPIPSGEAVVRKGTSVDIFLTQDKDKIKN